MKIENLRPVSPFEFAIMKIADPEKAKEYREYTEEEVRQQREDNIRRQMSKFKVKTS